MTNGEFAVIMAEICAYHNRTFNKVQTETWWDAFKSQRNSDFREGWKVYLSTSDFDRMPTIAQMLKGIQSVRERLGANEKSDLGREHWRTQEDCVTPAEWKQFFHDEAQNGRRILSKLRMEGANAHENGHESGQISGSTGTRVENHAPNGMAPMENAGEHVPPEYQPHAEPQGKPGPGADCGGEIPGNGQQVHDGIPDNLDNLPF